MESQGEEELIDKLRNAFDDMPIPFAAMKILSNENGKTYDFKFIYVNDALSELEGINKEDLLSKTYYERSKYRDNRRIEGYTQIAYRGGKNFEIEYYPNINRYIGINCYQLRSGYCGCIFSDVTDEKEKENDYKKQLYLYRTLNDSGVYTIKFDEEYTLLYANDRFYSTLGYTKETFNKKIANKCIRYVHPDDQDMVRRSMKNAILSGENYVKWEMRAITDEGTIKNILVTGGFVLQIDGSYNMNGVIIDITDKVWLEKNNIELLRISDEKTRFLSNMSHDIRTPINAILNLISIIRDDYMGIGDGDVMGDLDKMKSACDFLLSLINDILDMSKIESGKLELVPTVYFYEEFANYISCIFKPLCEKKKITFIWGKGKIKLPLFVDKLRFNQLVFNLLSNAIKYTAEGGTVYFETLDDVIKDGNLFLKIIITDTGCGMSEEFKKRMFGPFERDKIMSNEAGTGLGLTIAKKIIDLMHGTINIQSEIGKGTKVIFEVVIPLATEAQVEDYKAHAEFVETNINFTGKKFLVVDDNSMNRTILMRLLKKKGAVCVLASDGKEAVDIFSASKQGEFDLILMDIRMPVLDGVKATELIRKCKNYDARKIPIIAMSANAFDEDTTSAKKMGMTDYLIKPVEPNNMYCTIQKYLNKHDNE